MKIVPKARCVVLVGNKISPGNPVTKKDGTVVRTLWGELAWQLGGREALDRLRNVVGRIESSWRPASAEEGFEIVRRRLFEPLMGTDALPTPLINRDVMHSRDSSGLLEANLFGSFQNTELLLLRKLTTPHDTPPSGFRPEKVLPWISSFCSVSF